MANVYDVAAYILDRRGEMTAMKLQKLCYYSHAWNLVWDERPLFGNRIEAWANGPVIRDLYDAHRGNFSVRQLPGWCNARPDALDDDEVATIDAVLDVYGEMTAHQLSELTHQERPWQSAREGLGAGVRSNRPITDDVIAPYYDSLTDFADQS